MAKIKQVATAAGTFGVALGIGFIMQNGDALASRFGGDDMPDQSAPFTETAAAGVEVPIAFSGEEDMSAPDGFTVPVADEAITVAHGGVIAVPLPEMTNPELVAAAAVVLPEAAQLPEVQSAPVQLANLDPESLPALETEAEIALDCSPSMDAVAGASASVELAVVASCHEDTAFTVHHQGMMFSAMTDDAGEAKLIVPALAEVAVLITAFDDGDGAVATVVVPDFAKYDRAVLQWQGETSVMLSAYEDGAKFGDANHIFAGNPGDMARLEAAEGGYLMRLGDGSTGDGLVAEVYSFPTGMTGTAQDVLLVAEAEITAENCGQELNAQSIQVSPSGVASALDLRMVMPECDAVGDFLILQNMFEDLTIASR